MPRGVASGLGLLLDLLARTRIRKNAKVRKHENVEHRKPQIDIAIFKR